MPRKVKNVGGPTRKVRLRTANIDDIEAGLEELRAQQQNGGLVVDRPNEQLFFIDRKAKSIGTKQQRRAQILNRPLTIDQILQPASNITIQPQRKRSQVDAKLIRSRLKTVKSSTDKKADHKVPSLTATTYYDLWEGNVENGKNPIIANSHRKPQPSSEKTQEGKEVVRKVRSKTKAEMVAVKVPPPGASYNPTEQSRHKLIQQAEAEEQNRLQREAKIRAQIAGMKICNPLLDVAADPFFAIVQEETPSPALMDSSASFQPIAVVQQRKKTKAERNREARHHKKEQQRVEKDLRKRLSNQLVQVRTLAKQVHAETSGAEQRRLKRQKLRMQTFLNKQRLGPHRFTSIPIEAQLDEEVADSLRKLRPEGNLLQDRFKSLQERAIIEPRVEQRRRRKYRPKIYHKHAHKALA